MRYLKIILVLTIQISSFAQDLNTTLMNSTFQVWGRNQMNNTNIYGTCFVIGKPVANDTTLAAYVLVTAKHVFDDITENSATLVLRGQIRDSFYTFDYIIPIRNQFGKALYVGHDDTTIDICALPLSIARSDFMNYHRKYFINTKWLADDSMVTTYNLQEGDEVNFIGFPETITANKFGFPILRSGKIASYPLYPFAKIKKVYLDGNVFHGNSGSVVFVYSKIRSIKNNLIYSYQFILGMLVDRVSAKEEKSVISINTRTNDTLLLQIKDTLNLNLGFFVPAPYIKQTIDKLPVYMLSKQQK